MFHKYVKTEQKARELVAELKSKGKRAQYVDTYTKDLHWCFKVEVLKGLTEKQINKIWNA